MLTLFHIAPAFSNGDALEIFRGRDGKYEVIVAILPEVPTVGTVHFAIAPTIAQTSLPVTDAEIIVVAIDPEGEPAFRARALNLPDSLERYEANITFDNRGPWTMSVDIHSDGAGDGTVEFQLDLGEQPISSSRAGTVVFVVVLFALVGGSVYLWHSAQRRRR